MLLQFNFKNFMSFRDDTTLDMTATKISEHSDHIISIGHERILPISVIFGANASGKSNVLEAFEYMCMYVLNSLNYGSESEKRNKSDFIRPTPFLFDSKSKDEVSSFEVYFISSEETGYKSYNYGFTVDQFGVCEEWLNYRPKSSRGDYKRIFYRNNKKLDLSGINSKNHNNLQVALERETLIVSLGAKLKIKQLKDIRDWFFDNELADFGSPVMNYFFSNRLPYNFVESQDVQKNVVKYFSAFDSAIIGFKTEPIQNEDDEKAKSVRIEAVHRMIDSDDTATIPMKMESAGTLKMFALYPFLQSVLESGGTLFIDELNDRIHPLLVRMIVITFLNPDTNPKHAQLVFTSHDLWQLNNNSLRRDEIWFTEKSPDGISSLYSLVDFVDENGSRIRKDENYEKNYFLGKYGAIPEMHEFDVFKFNMFGGK